jgi:hypothetical protein
MQDIYNYISEKQVCGACNIIVIIIVLFDDAEELTTETHFCVCVQFDVKNSHRRLVCDFTLQNNIS